jgi:hypothetical protein
VAIAELAANGGAPMGFYTRFKEPEALTEIVRYYQFMKRYDDLFRANRPQSEVLLLFPRRKIHDGDLAPLERFRETGTRLLDEHVLFDIRPDDSVTPEIAATYRQVISLGDTDKTPPLANDLSRFEAPKTVRVSLSRPDKLNELTLHFVNYNRHEPKERRSAGGGIKDEQPIPVEPFRIDLLLPDARQVRSVEFLTPESPEPVKLSFEQTGQRLRCSVETFLVYGVVRIR